MSHTPDGYTPRPAFWAMRFGRLVFASAAAQEIGETAALLVLYVAFTEDLRGYRGPVTFWTDQLLTALGLNKWDQLDRARQKAIDAGWLGYQGPSRGQKAAGKYWSTVPHSWRDYEGISTDEQHQSIPNSVTTDTPNFGVYTNEYIPKMGVEVGIESGLCTGDYIPQMGVEVGIFHPIPIISLSKKGSEDERQNVVTQPDISASVDTTIASQDPSRNQEPLAPIPSPVVRKAKPRKQVAQPTLPEIPSELDTPAFRLSWNEFVSHRQALKKPLTAQATAKTFSQLTKWGIAKAIQALDTSIMSGWTGVFEPKENHPSKGPSNGKSNQPAYRAERYVPGPVPKTGFESHYG